MRLAKAYLYSTRSRREGFLRQRDVVYNGTFPIDLPFCSRFKDYNYSGESTDSLASSETGQGHDGGHEGHRAAARTIDEGIRSYFDGTDLGSLRRRRSAGSQIESLRPPVLTYAIDEPL